MEKRWSKVAMPSIVAPLFVRHFNWDVAVVTVTVMHSCNM